MTPPMEEKVMEEIVEKAIAKGHHDCVSSIVVAREAARLAWASAREGQRKEDAKVARNSTHIHGSGCVMRGQENLLLGNLPIHPCTWGDEIAKAIEGGAE